VDLAQMTAAAPDRNRLLALLLLDITQVLEQFAQSGFAPLREEWQRQHVYQGRPVRLSLPAAAVIDGTATGVDDAGALLLETATGVRRIHSGDVSLRIHHGA